MEFSMERKCSSMGWSSREGMGLGLWVTSGLWLGLWVVGGDGVEPFQTNKSLQILSIVGETC